MWTRSRKMEGDYLGQRWTMWFPCKEGVTPSDIHRRFWTESAGTQHCVELGTELQRWLSVGGTATPLKNCSVKPSGSSQGDGSPI